MADWRSGSADPSIEFYAALPSFLEFDDFAEVDAFAPVPENISKKAPF